MNAIETAGLACCRGEGESLTSWLRAGPLGLGACASVEALTSTGQTTGEQDRYCPACRVEELGRRRWYTRAEWQDPRCVVCSNHALPLVQRDAPPTRLRGRRWPRTMHAEFLALGQWIRGWSGNVSRTAGGPQVQPEALVLQAILARTDPRAPHSAALAEGQWRLWMDGWPVTAGPSNTTRRRTMPAKESDRLAVMAVTYRVCLGLQSGTEPNWPPLHIRRRTLKWLRGRLHSLKPDWAEHISLHFIQDT
jgi:hypothetical protein